MKKNLIIAIILGLLVLISIVQAFQLTTLKAKVDAGAVKIAGSKTAVQTTSGGSSGAATGNSLDNLPQMVGGC